MPSSRQLPTRAIVLVALAITAGCASTPSSIAGTSEPGPTPVGNLAAKPSRVPADPPPNAISPSPEDRELDTAPLVTVASPNERWVSQLFTSPEGPDGSWRSQLRVVDRSRSGPQGGFREWVASDEIILGGICGYDKEALGWSGDGRYFYFVSPGCGEGCVQSVGDTGGIA
jgi:hypothetical protein